MRALVMAAGLGTRLKPLTDNCPKPLVPVLGKPMIQYVLDHLATQGIREAILNIHYLPDQMGVFVENWNANGNSPKLFIQDESEKILGSGGGVAQAAGWLFEKDSVALICNADVIAFPSIKSLEAARQKLQTGCTLVVTKHPDTGSKYNGLRVQDGVVKGFEKTGVSDPSLFHFIGFYLIDRKSAQSLINSSLTIAETQSGPSAEEYSIVDTLWRDQIKGAALGVCEYDGVYLDLGTPEDLKKAESLLSKNLRDSRA